MSRKLSLIYYDTPDGDKYDIYEFNICYNSGGGDCLFKAISQCRNNGLALEHDHEDERVKVVEYVTDLKNWPKFKDFILGQHKDEIKEFQGDLPSDRELRKAYFKYMMTAGSYGTLSELEISSMITPFNFTLLRSDNLQNTLTVQNFHVESATRWFYFLFTGESSRGHWERLEPTYFETDLFENVPQEVFNEYGWEYNHRYMSNRPKGKRQKNMPLPLDKLKEFIGFSGSPKFSGWFSNLRSATSSLDQTDLDPYVCEKLTKNPSSFLNENGPERDYKVRFSTQPCCCNTSGIRKTKTFSKSTKKRRLSPSSILVVKRNPPPLQYSFRGSRVLVVGDAKSIGGDIAAKFYSDGAHVTMLIPNTAGRRQLQKSSPGIRILNADLDDFEAIRIGLNTQDSFNHIVTTTQVSCGNFMDLKSIDNTFVQSMNTPLYLIKYLISKEGQEPKCRTERTLVNVLQATGQCSTSDHLFSCQCKTIKTFIKCMAESEEVISNRLRVNCLQLIPTPEPIQEKHLAESLNEILTQVLFLSSELSKLERGATHAVTGIQLN